MRNQYSNAYKVSQEEIDAVLAEVDAFLATLAADNENAPSTPAPTPAIDVPCDLRTGEPEALPAARHLVNRCPRRSLSRDRRSAATTARYHLAELEARGRALVRDRTPLKAPHEGPKRTPKGTPSKSTTKTAPKHHNENVAAWKDTKALGKIIAANRAVEIDDSGEPYAWTLNIAPDVIARGIASPQGFASWLLKRIQRELTAAFPYREPFAITEMIDTTRTGRPHAHGLIACTDNELPAVEAALRRAGGAWTAACADRQVDTRPAWDSDGWTSYGTRNMAAAAKVVGSGVFAASASVKRSAKALHEGYRKLAKAA